MLVMFRYKGRAVGGLKQRPARPRSYTPPTPQRKRWWQRGKFVLWTPDEAIKIAGWAKEDLAETARQAFVHAQKRVAV